MAESDQNIARIAVNLVIIVKCDFEQKVTNVYER